jgi:hypothetical protein
MVSRVAAGGATVLHMKSTGVLRVCAAGCVAVLAACGGSSSKTASTVGGSSAPSSSSPAASASPAALPRLQKIVLQPADLPAGWKGTPYKPDPTDAAYQAALVRCVGARNTDPDKVAEAHSEDFELGDASISSSASSYPSQSDLDVDIAILNSPKISACYGHLFSKLLASILPAGAKVDSVSIKITPGSAGGPANVVATGAGVIKVKVNGQRAPAMYVTVAFITGPLIEAEVDTFNVGRPVRASLVKSLVATVANRAAEG